MSASRPALSLYLLTLIVLFLLASCRNNTVAFVPEEQVQITCTQECADRGQCGTLPDERRAVLAHDSGPAVSLHNRFFVDGTLVTILEVTQRELYAARDGVALIGETTPFPHIFYRVTGDNKTAWVSEWCVARP